MQIFTLIFALFILTGCFQDRSFGIFKKDIIYQKAIKNTQKGDIINSSQTKAVFIASYLNQIYPQFRTKNNEYFYIGVYINDEFSNQNSGLEKIEYNITLNGFKPISIKVTEDNDRFKRELAFINSWFKYYIVEFDKSDEEDLNLTFNYNKFGSTELKFIK